MPLINGLDGKSEIVIIIHIKNSSHHLHTIYVCMHFHRMLAEDFTYHKHHNRVTLIMHGNRRNCNDCNDRFPVVYLKRKGFLQKSS